MNKEPIEIDQAVLILQSFKLVGFTHVSLSDFLQDPTLYENHNFNDCFCGGKFEITCRDCGEEKQ